MDIERVSPGQQGSLVLAAFPTNHIAYTVQKVTPVSFTEEGRNYFRVEARLNDPPDERLLPGMEGVGKIDIDRRHLFWIWTHKAVDWLRLTCWAWMP